MSMMTRWPRAAVASLVLAIHVGLAPSLYAQDAQTQTDPVATVAEATETGGTISEAETPLADSPEWAALADRAETVIEAGDSSDLALSQLREELVRFRETFATAQDTNRTRIATLNSQIAALGPVPEEGAAPEPDQIAARREELNAQLARLQAPGLRAEEAYNRADGLIGEIDGVIRERQTDALFLQGPSPLNPTLWGGAWTTFSGSLIDLTREVTTAIDSASQQDRLKQRLPQIFFFLAIAFALVLRGRYWMDRLTQTIASGRRFQGTEAAVFAASLGQVVVPVLGMIALRQALVATDVLGLRGQILADALPLVGLIVFGGLWLGGRLYPRNEDIVTPMDLNPEWRTEARWDCGLLGVMLAGSMLIGRLAEFESYDEAVRAVLFFPFIVLTGLLLIRIGMLISAAAMPGTADPTTPSTDMGYLQRALGFVGKVVMFAGGIGPLMAAAGYLNGAIATIFPAVLSLALIGVLSLFHLLTRDVYALLRGRSADEASEALTPVLVSFLLVMLSLPLFALIWGARVTDLYELWTRFREGFAIGDTRLSPEDFLTFVLVFAVGYILTRLLQSTLKVSVLPKTRMDTGGRNAVTAGVGYVGIFLAAVAAITTAGIDLSSLAIVAGALSVGIGFGLQTIVSNFVSGIILLIERPISEGDWIEVGGQMGYVRDISVRSTRIETFDRTDVIVPNADFVSGTVTNWTRGNLVGRCIVPVGVAYGTDTRKVEKLLAAIAADHPMVVMNPPPAVLFMGFGADSMDFEIRAILRDVNFVMSVRSDMNHEIAAVFAREGIEIPFAQRDVWLRNPETLRQSGDAAEDKSLIVPGSAQTKDTA